MIVRQIINNYMTIFFAEQDYQKGNSKIYPNMSVFFSPDPISSWGYIKKIKLIIIFHF